LPADKNDLFRTRDTHFSKLCLDKYFRDFVSQEICSGTVFNGVFIYTQAYLILQQTACNYGRKMLLHLQQFKNSGNVILEQIRFSEYITKSTDWSIQQSFKKLNIAK